MGRFSTLKRWLSFALNASPILRDNKPPQWSDLPFRRHLIHGTFQKRHTSSSAPHGRYATWSFSQFFVFFWIFFVFMSSGFCIVVASRHHPDIQIASRHSGLREVDVYVYQVRMPQIPKFPPKSQIKPHTQSTTVSRVHVRRCTFGNFPVTWYSRTCWKTKVQNNKDLLPFSMEIVSAKSKERRHTTLRDINPSQTIDAILIHRFWIFSTPGFGRSTSALSLDLRHVILFRFNSG